MGDAGGEQGVDGDMSLSEQYRGSVWSLATSAAAGTPQGRLSPGPESLKEDGYRLEHSTSQQVKIKSVAFSPGGTTIATGDMAGSVTLYVTRALMAVCS